ncbi:MAG TPA: methionyl-tRNA formyltransferase [Candidatus Saccharimonadales bacterium]
MKKTSKKILFFGNERLATGVHSTVSTLQALLASGYQVEAVVVAQREAGKSRSSRRLEVAVIVEQHNIPLLAPTDLQAARDELAAFGAEAAVLIAYGKIVPQAVLDLFPQGIVNVHPSLLPLHRGSAPLESVILEGARETGVSLMRLVSKMDAGPVYAQKTVALQGDETKQALADRLAAIGADMVLEHLPSILKGSSEPRPQNDSAATYDQLINKDDSQLDWSKPATRLEREVRAYAGWPRSRARLGSTDVIITQAHVGEASGQPGTLITDNKQLEVCCGQGSLLIDSLIPVGKQEMSAKAFLAGYNLN